MPYNQIINGDCVELMKSLSDNEFVMTLTDIPYGEVSRPSNGLRNLDKGIADVETFDLDEFVNEVVRVTSGSIYIFCSTEQMSGIKRRLIEHGLATRLCILQKSNPSPLNGQYIWLSGIECCVFGKKSKAPFNEHCKNTVWKYPVERKVKHTTPKPLKLCEYLIKVSSNPGDVIFDPCIGSGTTAVAAINTDRKYFGCELDIDTFELCKSRIDEI